MTSDTTTPILKELDRIAVEQQRQTTADTDSTAAELYKLRQQVRALLFLAAMQPVIVFGANYLFRG